MMIGVMKMTNTETLFELAQEEFVFCLKKAYRSLDGHENGNSYVFVVSEDKKTLYFQRYMNGRQIDFGFSIEETYFLPKATMEISIGRKIWSHLVSVGFVRCTVNEALTH